MKFVRNILFLVLGGTLLVLFMRHFSGIPGIAWDIPITQKESAAREIQYFQLLLIVPAILLCLLGLSGFHSFVRVVGRFTRLVVKVPRKYFIIVLFVVAFSGSAFISSHYLYRSPQIIDSHNYYFQARIFNEGRIWVPSEPYIQKFFNFLAIMDTDGRRYGSSFPGHPFFLAIGEFLGVPWLVNPFQGGLIVVLIYLLGATLFSEGVGRLAGLLALFSPFRLFQCSLFMAHPTATLWILVFMLVLFHYFKEQNPAKALAIGSIAAVLYLTRPQSAAPVLLPFALYYLWMLARRKMPFRHVFLMIIPLSLAIAASFFYNKELTGDYFVSPRDIASPSLRLGFGDDVGRPLPGGGFSGHSLAAGLRNTRDNILLLVRETLGWGGWTVLFLMWALVFHRRRTIPVLMLLSGFIIIALYLAYPINSPLFGARYYFEWLPFYILLVSLGMWEFWQYLITRLRSRSYSEEYLMSIGTMAIVLFIVMGALLFLPSQIDRYYLEIYPNTMKQAAIEARIEKGIIFYKGHYFSQAYAFAMNDPLLKNELLFANDLGDEENATLKSFFKDRPCFRFKDAPKGRTPENPISYLLE